MIAITTIRSGLLMAMLALFLVGCATTPQPNATLDEAREKVGAIADNPQINRHAGAELRQALEHLATTERLWRDREDAREVSHHARLAMRQADIAEEATRSRLADQRVAQLRTEREQLSLQAQAARAELDAARARTDRTRAESERRAETEQRMRAEQERARAEEERRLADLQRRQADEARRQADQARRQADEARLLAEQRAEELERQTARMRAEAERLQQQLAELEARPTERGLVLTLGADVLFDFDRADVKPGARRTLERIAGFLNEYPERQVLIEGFTDSTGSRQYNMELSDRRARAVRDTLVDMGVGTRRMQIQGFGPDHPVASNDSEAGRQLNRRVEVIISDDDEAVPGRN
jgi:outer membrane protein OmpA-like peptidoglycan-associated protein